MCRGGGRAQEPAREGAGRPPGAFHDRQQLISISRRADTLVRAEDDRALLVEPLRRRASQASEARELVGAYVLGGGMGPPTTGILGHRQDALHGLEDLVADIRVLEEEMPELGEVGTLDGDGDRVDDLEGDGGRKLVEDVVQLRSVVVEGLCERRLVIAPAADQRRAPTSASLTAAAPHPESHRQSSTCVCGNLDVTCPVNVTLGSHSVDQWGESRGRGSRAVRG